MKLHERERGVRMAVCELHELITKLQKKRELTDLETLKIIQEVSSNRIADYIKYEIRYERHGTYDIPGGLADESEEGGKVG